MSSTSADTITLFPFDLVSKFGFEDGDVMFHFMEDHGLDFERLDHHDLLIAVVEQLLVPRLDQAVETFTLVSLHNPIRAGKVDGQEASYDSVFTPESVEIPVAEILEIAASLVEPDEEPGQDWSTV